jgi:hypothetical protein
MSSAPRRERHMQDDLPLSDKPQFADADIPF